MHFSVIPGCPRSRCVASSQPPLLAQDATSVFGTVGGVDITLGPPDRRRTENLPENDQDLPE